MMRQHKTPCAECPFRRDSLKGWLGGLSAEEFRALAQSEQRMPCHIHAPTGFHYHDTEAIARIPECAGRAIHWANQLKKQRVAGTLLELPRDTELVFERTEQFIAHHRQGFWENPRP